MQPKRVLIWMVGALLLVELSATAVLQTGVTPLEHYSNLANGHAVDIEILAGEGIRSDVVLLGSSAAGNAFDASTLERTSGYDWVHNLSLDGAQPAVVRSWLREIVEPGLNPECVIIGIVGQDVNDNRLPQRTIVSYESARATKRGWSGELDRSAASLSGAMRLRPVVQELVGLGPGLFTHPSDETLHELGDYRPNAPAGRTKARESIVRGFLHDYDGDGEEWAELEALFDEYAGKIGVIALPVPTWYGGLFPEAGSHEEYLEQLVTLTDAHQVNYEDLSASMSDSDFVDFNHLSPEASVRFTELSADFIEGVCSQ